MPGEAGGGGRKLIRCPLFSQSVLPGNHLHPRDLPIGIFDSGVGGLTVLRALRAALPDENFLYLGDTARVPYGTRSPETVRRYAGQAARLLFARGVKALVVACNTASAAALDTLRAEHPEVLVE